MKAPTDQMAMSLLQYLFCSEPEDVGPFEQRAIILLLASHPALQPLRGEMISLATSRSVADVGRPWALELAMSLPADDPGWVVDAVVPEMHADSLYRVFEALGAEPALRARATARACWIVRFGRSPELRLAAGHFVNHSAGALGSEAVLRLMTVAASGCGTGMEQTAEVAPGTELFSLKDEMCALRGATSCPPAPGE